MIKKIKIFFKTIDFWDKRLYNVIGIKLAFCATFTRRQSVKMYRNNKVKIPAQQTGTLKIPEDCTERTKQE
jgi:stress response protein SCP2